MKKQSQSPNLTLLLLSEDVVATSGSYMDGDNLFDYSVIFKA